MLVFLLKNTDKLNVKRAQINNGDTLCRRTLRKESKDEREIFLKWKYKRKV